MFLFELDRKEDPSGVSGPGIVAQGCVFDDGSVSIRWVSNKPSTSNWNRIGDAIDTHGHQGRTYFQIVSPKAVPSALDVIDAQHLWSPVDPG